MQQGCELTPEHAEKNAIAVKLRKRATIRTQNSHKRARENGVRPGNGALPVRLKDTIQYVKLNHVEYLLLGFYPHLHTTDEPEVRTRNSHKTTRESGIRPARGPYLST